MALVLSVQLALSIREPLPSTHIYIKTAKPVQGILLISACTQLLGILLFCREK